MRSCLFDSCLSTPSTPATCGAKRRRFLVSAYVPPPLTSSMISSTWMEIGATPASGIARFRREIFRPQGLKPLSFCALTARLKSCPDTKQKACCELNLDSSVRRVPQGRLKSQPRRSAFPRGTVQFAYHHPGLRPGILSDRAVQISEMDQSVPVILVDKRMRSSGL
jgi:hypothetical protein